MFLIPEMQTRFYLFVTKKRRKRSESCKWQRGILLRLVGVERRSFPFMRGWNKTIHQSNETKTDISGSEDQTEVLQSCFLFDYKKVWVIFEWRNNNLRSRLTRPHWKIKRRRSVPSLTDQQLDCNDPNGVSDLHTGCQEVLRECSFHFQEALLMINP